MTWNGVGDILSATVVVLRGLHCDIMYWKPYFSTEYTFQKTIISFSRSICSESIISLVKTVTSPCCFNVLAPSSSSSGRNMFPSIEHPDSNDKTPLSFSPPDGKNRIISNETMKRPEASVYVSRSTGLLIAKSKYTARYMDLV